MPDFPPFKPRRCKLVDRRAVPCESTAEWREWFASADRRVDETWIDDLRVLTVFLGLDHNVFEGNDPDLFQTSVIVADVTHVMHRYFIWEEAQAGHAEVVALIREEMASAQVEAVAAWEAVSMRRGADDRSEPR